MLYEGLLTSESFDEQFLEQLLSYLFETRKEALRATGSDTLLSMREAEVSFLREQGCDDEMIVRLMEISSSNLTEFSNRIEKRVSEAKSNRKQANRTLRLLRDSWVDVEE